MKKIFLGLAAVLVFWALPLASNAAGTNHYVRAGASGGGTDWTNAYGSLPSSLVRGDTYYIAAGTYGGHDFTDVESGSLTITIKKATSADHGTATGWQSSYANQAVFTDGFSFARKYYVIDGQTRNENDWTDANSYGFRMKGPKGSNSSLIYMQDDNEKPGSSYVTIKYVDMGADAGTVCYDNGNEPCPGAAIYFLGVHNTGTDLFVSHCHIHNIELPAQLDNINNGTFDSNYIGPSWQKEGIRGQGLANNWTIKNNVFHDVGYYDGPTTGLTAEIAAWNDGSRQFDNWQIYGNVFWDDANEQAIAHDSGVIKGGDSSTGSSVSGWQVYNNTLVGIGSMYAKIKTNGTGNTIYNNLWYNIGSGTTIECDGSGSGTGVGCSHNWCYKVNPDQSDLPYGANCSKLPGGIQGSSDPFVNSSAGNFNLKSPAQMTGISPVDKGMTLDSSYDPVDAYGRIRGKNGAWDIGAYEFGGADVIDTTPPSISISSPTTAGAYTSTSANISLAGVASDNIGVTAVTWSNSLGGSGSAVGTSNWTASVSLKNGSNVITVFARDAAGNTKSAILTVSYSSPNCIKLTQSLAYGDGEVAGTKTADINNLQKFLISLNTPESKKIEMTGFFGSNTLTAVLNFQTNVMKIVQPNGVVGPLTTQKIIDLTCQ